jgi:hypothetical protein
VVRGLTVAHWLVRLACMQKAYGSTLPLVKVLSNAHVTVATYMGEACYVETAARVDSATRGPTATLQLTADALQFRLHTHHDTSGHDEDSGLFTALFADIVCVQFEVGCKQQQQQHSILVTPPLRLPRRAQSTAVMSTAG